ncbi:uncharacterized protein LOC135714650 [Ochlerotatus camptorhynchus]|uniref:uncharacterized protein LOC135714650 n=1 Tax=Ochlerotatus camptorhynchus TaxID=644619 RepID=UPI0031D0609C
MKQINGRYVYVLLYVDDLIITCNTEQEYQAVVEVLARNFKITELGELSCFLGIQVRKQAGAYVLNQKSYISKTLIRFGMEKANTSRVPMASGYLQQQQEESDEPAEKDKFQSLIGALLYVAINSRPDISIATSVLGRRVSKPGKADWIEAKKVLRYLKGTINHELYLGANEELKLECFVDADWAGEVTDRKSNTGFLFKFGGGLIQWCPK